MQGRPVTLWVTPLPPPAGASSHPVSRHRSPMYHAAMTDPQPARRRVLAEASEPGGGHRTAWLVGGVLGIVAGVVVAFLVVPPVFDHYFGVADIELGKRYRTESSGREAHITVREVRSGPEGTDSLEIVLAVDAPEGWGPGDGTFRLRWSDGLVSAATTSEPPLLEGADTGSGSFEVVLRYQLHPLDGPRLDVLEYPGVRFHLQPGEPE
jgi:hypothetical protein